MIFALILTLSVAGQFEIRTEGSFQSVPECLHHMHLRAAQEQPEGDVFYRCISEDDVETVLRMLIGGRA